MLKFVRGGDLLEVGAAFGYFLEEAEAAGFRVSGLDVSDVAVARLRGRFSRVYHGELPQFDFRGVFDVLVLFDTLEHIYDLPGLVAAAHAALRPHGILAIATSHNRSLAARVLGHRWWSPHVPEHVVYFNDESIARLLAPRFTIVYTEWDWPHISLAAGAERLRSLSRSVGGVAAWALRCFRLGGITMRIPNGEKLYIARRNELGSGP